jgi:hypothetical protein
VITRGPGSSAPSHSAARPVPRPVTRASSERINRRVYEMVPLFLSR